MKGEFDARRWIEDMNRRAQGLQTSDGQFAGLVQPFSDISEKLHLDFKASAAIKHPGDKGTAREGLIREFLGGGGYLPAKYALSAGSTHVLSSSGHISAQVDLLLYDALAAPRLMSVGGIQYFPVESCYGLIESKSDLNSRERVVDALDKIASFKRLQCRTAGRLTPTTGFGIVVAFTTSLRWETLFEAIREWKVDKPPQEWPNLVVVLDHGTIVHANDRDIAIHTPMITRNDRLQAGVIGADTLLNFYLCLMDLLGNVTLQPAPMAAYAKLPLTAGRRSYDFAFGSIGSMGTCSKHGDYSRRLQESAITLIMSHCPQDAITDVSTIMMGTYGDAYVEVSGVKGASAQIEPVSLYNPDELPLPQIMLRPTMLASGPVQTLAFDNIIIDGRQYWIPQFYAVRDSLISQCPACGHADLSAMTLDDWWLALRQALPGSQADPQE